MTLLEALQDVQLEPGRVYNLEVDDCLVEVRVRKRIEESVASHADPAIDLESDTMLDAWVEFPIRADRILKSRLCNTPHWPDPPDIPQDESES